MMGVNSVKSGNFATLSDKKANVSSANRIPVPVHDSDEYGCGSATLG
jgi:hypothetical protein